MFQIRFGKEQLSIETSKMLLYGQLQEGLLYNLTEEWEERRLNELKNGNNICWKKRAPDQIPYKVFFIIIDCIDQ